MLPAFYKTGTLADMSRMARKLALARKAIAEIRYIEDALDANKDSLLQEDLQRAMRETKDFALVVANSTREAIGILQSVKANVGLYRESVHDVVD